MFNTSSFLLAWVTDWSNRKATMSKGRIMSSPPAEQGRRRELCKLELLSLSGGERPVASSEELCLARHVRRPRLASLLGVRVKGVLVLFLHLIRHISPLSLVTIVGVVLGAWAASCDTPRTAGIPTIELGTLWTHVEGLEGGTALGGAVLLPVAGHPVANWLVLMERGGCLDASSQCLNGLLNTRQTSGSASAG